MRTTDRTVRLRRVFLQMRLEGAVAGVVCGLHIFSRMSLLSDDPCTMLSDSNVCRKRDNRQVVNALSL